MSFQTVIRETSAIQVAALAHRGDYNNIGATFGQLVAVAAEMNLIRPATRSFAIYYDDPSATAPDALRSAACLTAPEGWQPGGRLEMREINAGRYAVTLHVGPYENLGKAYQWLYEVWLQESGETLAQAPIVEEYLNDARTTPPAELRTAIWLPLR